MLGKLHGKWPAGLLLSGLLVVFAVAGAFVFHLGTMPKVNTSTALWPAVASPGSMILATGKGFPVQERVQVYFQTPDRGTVNTLTNADGSFSVPLTMPSAYIPGTQYYVYVNSDAYSAKMLFHFAKLGISLTDPSAQLTFGSSASVTGQGFKPDEKVNLAWSYTAGSTGDAGTVVTGSDGSFTTTLTMPSIPQGVQAKLVATGVASGFSTSTMITEAAGLTYDPSSASAGEIVNLQGGGLGPGELVNVSFEGSSVATAKTNANGSFTTAFVVPDSDQIGYQDHAIVVTGTSSKTTITAGFQKRPKITIAPNHGKPGTSIHVSGVHFSPKKKVNIYFVIPKGGSRFNWILLATVNTSARGTFTVTVTAPKGLAPNNLVEAVDVKTGIAALAVFYGK